MLILVWRCSRQSNVELTTWFLHVLLLLLLLDLGRGCYHCHGIAASTRFQNRRPLPQLNCVLFLGAERRSEQRAKQNIYSKIIDHRKHVNINCINECSFSGYIVSGRLFSFFIYCRIRCRASVCVFAGVYFRATHTRALGHCRSPTQCHPSSFIWFSTECINYQKVIYFYVFSYSSPGRVSSLFSPNGR